jgi:succinate dehydrogenase / fumarate reductase iron-sulfur subunit
MKNNSTETDAIQTKNITVKVFRFDADSDILPYYREYKIEVTQEDVVLDILNKIKWEHSGSLSYRRSCRHGICGSCAVKVNTKGVLACKERVFDLIDIFGKELVIDPLSEKRAVKDLIIDKTDFWEKHDSVIPYLDTVDEVEEHPACENIVTPHQAEELLEADYCIQCGACYYSCPVVEINENYIGPSAFAKAFRFNADVRDDSKEQRIDIINAPESGVWDCVKCFECTQVCPKDVNPLEKITKLHNQVFETGKAIDNVATRHAVGFKHSIDKHGFLDEAELVRYSEGTMNMGKHLPEAWNMLTHGKLPMPWNMPKSENLDEVKKIVKTSSTAKF